MRKPVSESLSGISTVALPASSSGTRAFQSSSVSNSSRVVCRPPPPPAGTALRPKWRWPITCICAVDVSTSIAAPRSSSRRAVSRSVGQQLEQALVDRRERDLGAVRRRAAVGAAHADRHLRLVAHRVRRARRASTLTSSSCAAQPTSISARPILYAGLARSTSAVGATPPMRPRTSERRHEHVRRVAALDRDLDHRRLARHRAHERFQHALALDGDERCGLLERHAHLEARRLAGLVALALGQQVDAVVVGGGERPLVVGRRPTRRRG